ncbi:cell division protein FtsB [Candidatus Methylocalor cossyra]|uniref:Cell division protein FtsB n=1 Tax=Candidatus Methylocalor cossyra TaxID=3108543 RepID=A0ABP1C7H6_9GAMM
MGKLIAFLLVLIALLQFRLWFGDGGILELYQLQARIEELKLEGQRRQERNAALEADVNDLKEGTDAIEERARQELGMVKEGETFVQVFEKPRQPAPAPNARAAGPSP